MSSTSRRQRRPLTVDEEYEIAKQYLEGASLSQLMKRHGRSKQTVRGVITKSGGSIRLSNFQNQECWKPASTKEAAEIVRRYLDGESSTILAKEFGRGKSTIKRILADADVSLRENKVLTDRERQDITSEYTAGISIYQLSAKFRRGTVTVRNILTEAGLVIRPRTWDGYKNDPSDEDKLVIYKKFTAGGSVVALADEYHRSHHTINAILTEMGAVINKGAKPGVSWTPEHRTAHLAAVRTEEFREKQRKRVIDHMSLMAGVQFGTFIEQALWMALARAGISFKAPSKILNYLVDIELFQAPVVIEADGWAFHSTPEQRSRDAYRDDRIKNEYGDDVYRFWGWEIKKDADACVADVIDSANLHREINPHFDVKGYQIMIESDLHSMVKVQRTAEMTVPHRP